MLPPVCLPQTYFDGRHSQPAVLQQNSYTASSYSFTQPTNHTTSHENVFHFVLLGNTATMYNASNHNNKQTKLMIRLTVVAGCKLVVLLTAVLL